MQEVYEFLKNCGTYYLATVDGDQPRVRPFGTVDIFEGKLYIQTGKVKDVSKQLLKNPKAEICAFANGTWVRVAGELIPDERIEAKQHMLGRLSLPAGHVQGGRRQHRGAVFPQRDGDVLQLRRSAEDRDLLSAGGIRKPAREQFPCRLCFWDQASSATSMESFALTRTLRS